MAGKNVFNDKDSMDISELASLNDDISPELIEQLQQKLAQDAKNLNAGDKSKKQPAPPVVDDAALFEEPAAEGAPQPEAETPAADTPQEQEPKPEIKENTVKKDIKLDENFDDNFIKKYKAKLSKQQENANETDKSAAESTISSAAFAETPQPEDIEKVSNGNIIERKLTPEQKSYNDSLDFLDGNIKYSKYVIYIDPKNVDFIEGLTVKERKNLINNILKEQNDIAVTKQRFKIIQTVIRHAIVAILTIAISIPVIYITINASLEATINNYRRSQTIFQTLYKEKGKIQSMK